MNWNNTEYVASYGLPEQLPEITLPEIAFSGHSNVGKSTLINKLCGRKNLARVSSEPGKTRCINYFNVDGSFFICDLPGYGYAKVSKQERERWANLMEFYLNSEREYPDLVVQLIDMRHEPTKEDISMVNFLLDTETPFIIALTKADKLRPLAREKRLLEFAKEIPEYENINIIPFSSVTGEGVERIHEIILDALDTIDE